MTQLQMLNCSWLDQELFGWIEVLLLPQSLVRLLGFGGNHSLLSLFNTAAIILRPDKYNNMTWRWLASKLSPTVELIAVV